MSKDQPNDPAKDFFPSRKSLKAFLDAGADCKACDLWKHGTQTVFGEGSRQAEIFFVGEQPGNEEDLSGQPFVGQFIESTPAPYIMATVHPSSILRAPDDETRHAEKRRFIDDLKKVARVISKNK